MTERRRIEIPPGKRIYEVLEELGISKRPRLTEEEKAKRKAEDEEFRRRCHEIFYRVYPELVGEYYNWYIHIEPKSGDYFIDPDEEASLQKAKQKHPNARILAMRLNETRTIGRV